MPTIRCAQRRTRLIQSARKAASIATSWPRGPDGLRRFHRLFRPDRFSNCAYAWAPSGKEHKRIRVRQPNMGIGFEKKPRNPGLESGANAHNESQPPKISTVMEQAWPMPTARNSRFRMLARWPDEFMSC